MKYKIKVTPETSAEVQELFFELGYRWSTQDNASQEPKYTDSREYIFAYQEDMRLTAPYLDLRRFESRANQEITLPQLRDMVVLNRNSVGDATHEDNYGMLWFIGCSHYLWNFESKRWIKEKPMYLRFKEINKEREHYTEYHIDTAHLKDEITELKKEEIKYKEKHGQLIGKIHVLEKKLARYENPDYVLVPREPTAGMLEALDRHDNFYDCPAWLDSDDAYIAMIEAMEKDNAIP